ncbi:MAG: lytic transglycosylase domain-containing protein [Bradymonadaceae bacterium]
MVISRARMMGGLVCAAFMLLLAVPSTASAQIYTYETPSGETLITTEKRNRPGYRLVESVDADRRSPRIRSARPSSAASSAPARRATMGSSTMSFSERERLYDDIIREAAKTYDVPFGFVKAVIRIESAFQKDAVSHAGAMGLMQLMPRTAASLDVTDAFHPRQNIFGGAKFLRILIDRYDGDINLILAAYNAGDVAVKRYDGIPYAKTRQYVASVYHWYQVYAAQEVE